MKATGIIRRIDDLGRVVIPKELRRVFNIREGDALEIFTTDEGIVFAPYDNQVNKETFATNWLRKYKDALLICEIMSGTFDAVDWAELDSRLPNLANRAYKPRFYPELFENNT